MARGRKKTVKTEQDIASQVDTAPSITPHNEVPKPVDFTLRLMPHNLILELDSLEKRLSALESLLSANKVG